MPYKIMANSSVSVGYSATMLNHDWPLLYRQITMIACSCVGTILHAFFFASFCVENSLKRSSLVFMIWLGVADAIIPTVVVPCVTAVLFMRQMDNESLCLIIVFLSKTSTHAYSLCYMLVALETYFRLCESNAAYQPFTALRFELISIAIICLSMMFAAIGLYIHFKYSYCDRSPFEYLYFRLNLLLLLHVIPFCVTISCLLSAATKLRKQSHDHIHIRRSGKLQEDIKSTSVHIFAYLLFVVTWCPYLMVTFAYPDSSDGTYYLSVWLGLGRSIISSGIYGYADCAFRRAFGRLLSYLFLRSPSRPSSQQRS